MNKKENPIRKRYREGRRGDLHFFKMVIAWLGVGLLLIIVAVIVIIIIT